MATATWSNKDKTFVNAKDMVTISGAGQLSSPITIPKKGLYRLETWGAGGGNIDLGRYINSSDPNFTPQIKSKGGVGGYAVRYVELNQGDKLYVYCGEHPADITRGFDDSEKTETLKGGKNGGGAGRIYRYDFLYGGLCASGGGATHIAKVSGDITSIANDNNFYVVAGGGGGGAVTDNWSLHDGNWDEHKKTYSYDNDGGSGGGTQGETGMRNNSNTGNPWSNHSDSKTQVGSRDGGAGGSSKYTTKKGQDSPVNNQAIGAGGGGFYGGRVAGYASSGGGGGAGYIGSSSSLNYKGKIYNNINMLGSEKLNKDDEKAVGLSTDGKARITLIENSYPLYLGNQPVIKLCLGDKEITDAICGSK